MQYDEWLRTSNVLKFSEYISYIKIKKSGPSSWSLHEKKCILLSVMEMATDKKNTNILNDFLQAFVFSRGHATLHLAVSVGPLVRLSVRPSVRPSVTLYFFWVFALFDLTASAQVITRTLLG